MRAYLPMDSVVLETDGDGHPISPGAPSELGENTFYLFDADATAAMCHAIEDLALEEADGHFTASFQDFKFFETHRERYCHLAITIDRVEVFAAGKTPRPCHRIKYLKTAKGAGQDFRIALFEGRRHQALFVGRQTNKATAFEEKKFLGFYTFNPGLIARIRQDLADLAHGKSATLREFVRQQAIDQAAKQIKTEFTREREALSQAVRRLQLDGKRYPAENFASDLEKGLTRLHQWRTRLPEILAQAEGNPRP